MPLIGNSRLSLIRSLFMGYVLMASAAFPQSVRLLTLEECIAIALGGSYDANRLEQSLVSSRMSLQAVKASFRSNGNMVFSSFPDYQETERQTPLPGGGFVFDNQRFVDFQAELFVNQPIPATDGTFSLVGIMQRFQQLGEFEEVVIGPDGPGTVVKRDPTDYATNVRLQFRQPLFTLNQLKTGLKKAELNLENTTQVYKRSQLDIVFNVTINFHQLFRAQRQLEIDQERVKQSENAYRIASLKHQAGLLPELEALRLEVELANARNTAKTSEASLAETEDAFKVLIGIPLEDRIGVTSALDYELIEVALQKATSEALRRRTELRSDEISIELGELNVKETDALTQVEGELFLSYGVFNRQDDFSAVFNNPNEDRRVNFSLRVPLWDWGKNAREVQAAEANLENSRLAQRNRIDIIKQEIRTVVRNYDSARERIEITRRSEEVAEKSYRISLLKFENGDLSSQELALEQNRLTQAKTNTLSAIIDYKQALADLRRKTLWDFERNKPVIVEVPEE